MAHIKASSPDSGLGFQVKVISKSFPLGSEAATVCTHPTRVCVVLLIARPNCDSVKPPPLNQTGQLVYQDEIRLRHILHLRISFQTTTLGVSLVFFITGKPS